MDGGRKALLEKAREFGILARNMTLQDFLGVETLWWEEFWRSFSFSLAGVQGGSNHG